MFRESVAAVGFCLLSAVATAAAPAKQVCDGSLLPSCADLSSASLDASHDLALKLPVAKDGGAVFNAFAYTAGISSSDPKKQAALTAQQNKLMKDSPGRSKKALAIAERVRANAIALITNGQPPGTLTSEQKSLIKRLQLLRIDAITLPPESCGPEYVTRGTPNAAYSPVLHTLFLCRPMINITESQFIQAVAHEMGHVVSPCKANLVFYKVATENLYPGALAEQAPELFPNENGDAPKVDDREGIVSVMLGAKPSYTTPPDNSQVFTTLRDHDVLTVVPEATARSADFFKTTLNCLSKTYAAHYGTLMHDKVVDLQMSQSLLPKSVTRLSESALKDKVQRKIPLSCMGIVEENFADSFSAKIMGRMAAEAGWSAGDFRTALLLEHAYTCADHSHPSVNDKYPKSAFRVQTLMNDDAVAASLNCERPKDPKLCPIEISDRASGSSRASETSKSSQSKMVH